MTQEDKLAVLFADVCGSTALYEREGDSEAYARIQRTLDQLVGIVQRHGGTVIKTIGDEVMVTFPDCDAAMQAASEMAQGLFGRLPLRVGVHFGSVICDVADIFGDTVNVAARVVGLCQPGEILLTEGVAIAVSPRWRVFLRRMPDMPIKGKELPLRIFRFATHDEEMTVFAAAAPRTAECSAVELTFEGATVRVDAAHPVAVIGRMEPADLVVRLSHVSRRHATVEFTHGTFYLRDHSTNGTFVLSSVGDRHLLQREAMPMPAAGRIWPGVSPAEAPGAAIDFRHVD